MQMVIDIPDNKYQWIKDNPLTYDNEYCEAIRKGTPLDEVLDKIRAEIEAIIGEKGMDDYDYCSGLICARKIIDKYKAGG